MGNVASNNQDFDNTQVKNTFDQGIYDPELGKSLYTNDQFLTQLEPGLRPKLQSDQTFQSWLNSQISAAQTAATSTATTLSSDTLAKANQYTDGKTATLNTALTAGLTSATKYTDDKTNALNTTLTQAIIDKAAAVDTNAKGYASNALTTANQYTDGKTNALNTTLTNVVNQSVNPIQSYVNKSQSYMTFSDDGSMTIRATGDKKGVRIYSGKDGSAGLFSTDASGTQKSYFFAGEDGSAQIISKGANAVMVAKDSTDKVVSSFTALPSGEANMVSAGGGIVQADVDGQVQIRAKGGKNAVMYTEKQNKWVANGSGDVYGEAAAGGYAGLFANGGNVSVDTSGGVFIKPQNDKQVLISSTVNNGALRVDSTVNPAYTLTTKVGDDARGAVISLKSGTTDKALQFWNSTPSLSATDKAFTFYNGQTQNVASITNQGDLSINSTMKAGHYISETDDKGWNWYEVKRPDGQMFFGADEINRGIWSSGKRDMSIYTNNGKPTAKFSAADQSTTLYGNLNAGNRVLGSTDASNNFWMGLQGTASEDDRLAMGISGDAATGKVSQVNIRKPTTISSLNVDNGFNAPRANSSLYAVTLDVGGINSVGGVNSTIPVNSSLVVGNSATPSSDATVLTLNGRLASKGSDLYLGETNDGRGKFANGMTSGRALVKYSLRDANGNEVKDANGNNLPQLNLNYGGDFSGGVRIRGPLAQIDGDTQIYGGVDIGGTNNLKIADLGASRSIQSYGNAPLKINRLGNKVSVGNIGDGVLPEKDLDIGGDAQVRGGLYIKGKSQWSFKEDANGRLCFGVNGKDAACLQTNGYLVPA